MHDDTLREIVESVFGLTGTLAKEAVVRRNQNKRLSAERDHELEMARIRYNAVEEDVSEPEVVESSEPTTDHSPAEIEAAIDNLIAQETCGTCQELLRGLKDLSVDEQVRGVMEYGSFKRGLTDDADVDELRAALRETDVLKDVVGFDAEPQSAPAPPPDEDTTASTSDESEEEPEMVDLDFDISSYNAFFGDCRRAGYSTEDCGALWQELKKQGVVSTQNS